MRAFLSLLALSTTVLACRQSPPVADCDCQSTSYSLLTEKVGVYDRGYVRTISSRTGQVDGSYVLSCNPDFITGKAAGGDTIILSGRARPNCFKGETLIALPSQLELTAVRKQ